MEMGSMIRYCDLTNAQRSVIETAQTIKNTQNFSSNEAFTGGIKDNRFALAIKKGNVVHQIENAFLPGRARRWFQSEDNIMDIWRMGIVLRVVIPQGEVVRFDERFSLPQLKPIACGMVDHQESFETALFREMKEELFVCCREQQLSKKYKTTQIVPRGKKEDLSIGECKPFDILYDETIELGLLKKIGVCCNVKERSLDMTYQWTLGREAVELLPGKLIIGFHEGEWYMGGRSAIATLVCNSEKTIVGIFSGQQGYIKFNGAETHLAMKT